MLCVDSFGGIMLDNSICFELTSYCVHEIIFGELCDE